MKLRRLSRLVAVGSLAVAGATMLQASPASADVCAGARVWVDGEPIDTTECVSTGFDAACLDVDVTRVGYGAGFTACHPVIV